MSNMKMQDYSYIKKYNVQSNHIEGYPHDNQDICLGHQLMKGKHVEGTI